MKNCSLLRCLLLALEVTDICWCIANIHANVNFETNL